MTGKHHVVIIGGGFGGLCAARALRRAPVRVTLIDRRNHHLFQPLLYQVATGGLSPANIATPLRSLLKKTANVSVRLGEVTGFDLDEQMVHLSNGTMVPYDSLIVAAGAGQSYFGRPQWKELAPGLKSLEDATCVRRQVLLAFEKAELAADPQRVRDLLTFVVVGAGPTGVELAGALAELSGRTLAGEFRNIDPATARVLLVEGAERVLPGFSEAQSKRALRSLEKLGVEVKAGWLVAHITAGEVALKHGIGDDAERLRIQTSNVLWAAGVEGSPLGQHLDRTNGCGLDRSGRVTVQPDCSIKGRPNVFVIGDLANFSHGLERPLPGLAPVAMQQGRYVARVLKRRFEGLSTPAFRYADKGNLATIGRRMAVAEIAGLHFWGLPAWLTWLFVHLMYLTEFENRVLVLVQWGWNYITRNRSARLITQRLPDSEADGDPTTEKDDWSTGW